MGYDREHEEMKENVYLGAGMLAVTLSQIDEERNKRVMGCRAAMHRDFETPDGMHELLGVSIHVASMCDLVLKISLIPLISSMNRSIERAKKRGDVSSMQLLSMSQLEQKAHYDFWNALRESAFVNIDSYYNQWSTFISRMGLDRTDKQYDDRGWSPVSEDTVETGKKAAFAQKDRDKKQGKVPEKKGGWPSFKEIAGMVGIDDHGKPKVPEPEE